MNTPHYDLATLVPKGLYATDVRRLLTEACAFIAGLPDSDFNKGTLDKGLRDLARAHDATPTDLFQALRVALSGQLASPGLFETLEAIGKEETVRRIGAALLALSDLA